MSLAFALDDYDPDILLGAVEAEECERDLSTFYAKAWSSFDPAPYLGNWHIDAICEHLMAVTDGEIRKLLINVPYRVGKTNVVSVAWPAWTWAQGFVGPLSGPQVQFLCLSYGSQLSLDTAAKARQLIGSPWYQGNWGHCVQIAKNADSKEKYDTTKLGSRISVGFDGSTLGRGGAIKIIDDPHKVKEVESDQVREGVIQTYDESLASRFTDPQTSAEVIIMQRLHENDLSGYVIEKERGFTHLMLPMMYDPTRHCVTVIGIGDNQRVWQDPRGLDDDGELFEGLVLDDDGNAIGVGPGSPMAEADGALLWPERFDEKTVQQLMTQGGPTATAGQLQQSPSPRGGGIILKDWWQLWGDKFPDFGTVIVSADTAYTEKEANDYSAATVWGAFAGDDRKPKLMLKDAWQDRLGLSELVHKLAELCRKHKADYLLIEGKASGISVGQEIIRLFGSKEWTTIVLPVKGDKVARLNAVQPLFSGPVRKDPETGITSWTGGIIHAPNKEWADLVINACASFPKTKHKDLVDSTSQALSWLRANGVAVNREEAESAEEEAAKYKKPRRSPYDV